MKKYNSFRFFLLFFLLFSCPLFAKEKVVEKKMPREKELLRNIMEESQSQKVPFCIQDEEISQQMNPFFMASDDFYHSSSQGMCIAGNYLIYTRYASDNAETTYVVFDLVTKEEVGHYDFHTLHSNSLTYNPDKNEVVCVSKHYAYIFSFDNHELSFKESIYMPINFPKIAYVEPEQSYYLATDTKVYSTKDFHQITGQFKVPEIATDQGMAFDGKYLYIIWYNVGRNYIYSYDLKGNPHKQFSLISDTYREIEEVDFLGHTMFISIANSDKNNGLYYILSEHDFSQWETQKEATCALAGYKTRYCQECQYNQEKIIKITKKHKAGKWIVEKETTCISDGYRYQKCKKCKIKINEINESARGHAWNSWSQIPLSHPSKNIILERDCLICGHFETMKKDNVSKVEEDVP